METKTNTTALVVIPPQQAWPAIQTIRREHDRMFGRWMPHITMLYPFSPADRFDDIADILAPVCAAIEPLEITLGELRWFRHDPRNFTLWLAPDPRPMLALHEALWAALPHFDDTRRHPGGFAAHLTVGQAHSRTELQRVMAIVQAQWQPVSFGVDRVSLIRREDTSPSDAFEVDRHLPLGPGRGTR